VLCCLVCLTTPMRFYYPSTVLSLGFPVLIAADVDYFRASALYGKRMDMRASNRCDTSPSLG